MNTLKLLIESVTRVLRRTWAWKTSTASSTQPALDWRQHASAADADCYNIEIITGDFAGVWFRFGQIAVLPEEDGARFDFDYDILDSAGYRIEELTSEAFKYRLLIILQQYLGVQFGSH